MHTKGIVSPRVMQSCLFAAVLSAARVCRHSMSAVRATVWLASKSGQMEPAELMSMQVLAESGLSYAILRTGKPDFEAKGSDLGELSLGAEGSLPGSASLTLDQVCLCLISLISSDAVLCEASQH